MLNPNPIIMLVTVYEKLSGYKFYLDMRQKRQNDLF